MVLEWIPWEGYIPFTTLNCPRGCTDEAGTINYNELALYEDGTCVYDLTPGCTDPIAANYNCAAPDFGTTPCNVELFEDDDGQEYWIPNGTDTITIPAVPSNCNYGDCDGDQIHVYCCPDGNPPAGWPLIGNQEPNHWGVGNGICDEGTLPDFQCNTHTDCLGWGYFAECQIDGENVGENCLNGGQAICDAREDGSECVTNMIHSVDDSDIRLGCCGYPDDPHIPYNGTEDSYGCAETTADNYEEGITIPCNYNTHGSECGQNDWSYDNNLQEYVAPDGTRSAELEFTNNCCCTQYQTNSDAHKFKIHYKYSEIEVTEGTAFYYENGNYSTPKYSGGAFITGVVPIDENEKPIVGFTNNPGFLMYTSFLQDDGVGNGGVPIEDCTPAL